MNRHIYVTGIDGVGKTTQVDRLVSRLTPQFRMRRVWLRFPVLVSLPLLVYARIRGHTVYTTDGGVRVGSWEFQDSRLLRSCFPWAQLIDTVLLGAARTCLPRLLGYTLVFERYALDVLVDVMAATKDMTLHRRPVGLCFAALVPKGTRVVILDAPVGEVRLRRADLRIDPALETRARIYRGLAQHHRVRLIDASQTEAHVEEAIRTALGLP